MKCKDTKSVHDRYEYAIDKTEYSHPLYEALLEYTKGTLKDNINIPFHMPGHKRNVEYMNFVNPFMIDITEIDGFDNYHNPQGIIKESMDLAAEVYGTKESIYLVNGSTVGLLAGIYGVTDKKDKVIVARNCHKAVYNAVFHQELKAEYIYPQIHTDTGAYCGIDPVKLQDMLKKNTDVRAVIITSPTYEGVVSDIKKISEIVHANKAVLIVDEAHGAHLPYMDMFPKSAIYEGADIVIQSLHKLLPSLTQTAILHICSDRVDSDKVHRYLGIYQSSSPSYVMMASMDNCTRFMCRKETDSLIQEYYKNLIFLRKRINELNGIKLIEEYGSTMYDYDISKLVIKSDVLSGQELYDILHDKYKIQLEMASERYVIAMTSLCDNFEHYDILYNALREIDGSNVANVAVKDKFNKLKVVNTEKDKLNKLKVVNTEKDKLLNKSFSDINKDDSDENDVCMNSIGENNVCVPAVHMTIYEALNSEHEMVGLKEAAGRTSYEYVYLYPPGSPVIAPGEIISEELIDKIIRYRDAGLNLIGLNSDGEIACVKQNE